ncbi:MAG: hypothetical protein R3C19_04295 [Planctomycetaceae bacterium]
MSGQSTAEKLKRYTQLEYILVGDLRDLLEDPIDDDNLRWIHAVVDALLDSLPVEFELKRQGGYLREVLERHPNWLCHVATLESQHRRLCRHLRELRNRLSDPDHVEETARVLSLELKAWMDNFDAHNRQERRLMQTAMNLEVGTGD